MKPLSWALPTPLLTAAVSLSAIAQPPMDLGTTVVTATRTAETVDETLAPMSVVTREDIERLQARSVPELLRGLPGVQVTNNGGLGKNSSVFLRGTDSDHVLVLVDGVRYGSATLGLAAFQDLPMEQIDRIEVVRGPRSSLYGSEAIGGVIQIFTRRGSGETRPYASLGRGTDETWTGSVGVSGSGARAWYHAGISGTDTEGFNACDGDPATFAGCATREPDDDGYRNLAGSFRLGYRFGNGAEVEAHALHADTENDFDGSFVNESEGVQQVLGARVSLAPTAAWRVTAEAGRSRDELDSFKDGSFRSRFDTERSTASIQSDLDLAPGHLVTAGLDWREDEIDSSDDFVETSRDNAGLFVQYQGGLGAHDVQLALRGDDDEQFGSHTTGSVAWGYRVTPGLRLVASYGTAFKAPTFNDLYFPGFGNPDLGPEESRSIDLGVRADGDWGSLSLNAFDTRIDDLIAFDSATSAPANVDRARIRGLEVDLSTTVVHWSLSGSLTLLEPEDDSGGANDGNQLPRRAEQSLRVDADRRFGPWGVGATLLVESRRYDDLANQRELDAYATLDLRGDYRLARDWRVQAEVTNLLDEDYETAAFFNQPDRSLFVTLRYEPGA